MNPGASRLLKGLGIGIAALYGYGSCGSAVYFNYQFARHHGMAEWFVFGEVVPTLEGAAWPYFAYRHLSDLSARKVAEAGLDRSPRADSVRSLLVTMAAMRLLLDPPPSSDSGAMRLAFRLRSLIEIPEGISDSTLEWVYPGWGSVIHDDLVPAVRGLITVAELRSSGGVDAGLERRTAEIVADMTAYDQWLHRNEEPLLRALQLRRIVVATTDSMGSVVRSP